jgi:hypothetical protein
MRQDLGLDQAIIIALTGFGWDDDYRHLTRNDFNHHLIKPVQLESLKLLLSQSVEKSEGWGEGI